MTSTYTRDASLSGQVAGTPEDVFPEVPYSSIEERFITNPNASGSIWIRFCDLGSSAPATVAEANGAGSIEIPAGGQGWSGPVCNRISVVCAGAATLVTAGER